MNESLADQLRALVGGQPQRATGQGMVRQAGDALAGRGYQLHVQEAQAMGQSPMSQQQWVQSQRQ